MQPQTEFKKKIPVTFLKSAWSSFFAVTDSGVYTNKFCCRHLAVWCSQCGLHSDNMYGEHWGQVQLVYARYVSCTPLKINIEAKNHPDWKGRPSSIHLHLGVQKLHFPGCIWLNIHLAVYPPDGFKGSRIPGSGNPYQLKTHLERGGSSSQMLNVWHIFITFG